MAIGPQFITDFTAWSNQFTAALTEAELIPQAEAKARELLEAEGKPLDHEPINVAVTIAIAENAERIEVELNTAIGKILKEAVERVEFKKLNVTVPEEGKAFVEDVGQRCFDTCQALVSHYAPNPTDRTNKFLKLKRMRKYSEEFLFGQLMNNGTEESKHLLSAFGEYYISLQQTVTAKLQALRDNRETGSSKLTSILKAVYTENPPAVTNMMSKTFWKNVQSNIKEAVLVAFRNDLQSYVSAWLDQLSEGHLQLFSQTSDHTKQMILAAGTYSASRLPDDISAELRTALGLTGAVMSTEDFNRSLETFQDHIPLQEKYFTLLSLTLFFSEVYRVLATGGQPVCNPRRRHLFRALVLALFTRDSDIFPENEWVLVHNIEELIGHFLQPEDVPANAKLLVEEWNSTKGWFDKKIEVFNFVPLTPALYPGLHVTIAISGWMSQDSDMLENWKSIVTHMHYGAVYALNWEAGTTLGESSKFVVGAAGVVGAALIPVVGLVAAPIALYSLWKNQPFQTAAERAEETGRCLAHHIKNRAFGNVSVSLVCFSLGARVTAFCLNELMNEDTQYIQDVVLFGGAMSNEGWAERKRAISGRLINIWSHEDDILKFAYRTARFEEPAGLNPIQVEGVENVNTTKSVFGHMDHKSKFDKSMTSMNYIP